MRVYMYIFFNRCASCAFKKKGPKNQCYLYVMCNIVRSRLLHSRADENKHAHAKAHRQTNRKTDRQTARQTHTQTRCEQAMCTRKHNNAQRMQIAKYIQWASPKNNKIHPTYTHTLHMHTCKQIDREIHTHTPTHQASAGRGHTIFCRTHKHTHTHTHTHRQKGQKRFLTDRQAHPGEYRQ